MKRVKKKTKILTFNTTRKLLQIFEQKKERTISNLPRAILIGERARHY